MSNAAIWRSQEELHAQGVYRLRPRLFLGALYKFSYLLTYLQIERDRDERQQGTQPTPEKLSRIMRNRQPMIDARHVVPWFF